MGSHKGRVRSRRTLRGLVRDVIRDVIRGVIRDMMRAMLHRARRGAGGCVALLVLCGGVGFAQPARSDSLRLVVRLTDAATGRRIDDGAVLASDVNDVDLEVQLAATPRDDSTRFRVRLRRVGAWSLTGRERSVGPERGDALESGTRAYHDLAPGRYTMQVWGYDRAGRVYGPTTTRFTVEAPLAVRWYALLAYALLVIGAVTAMYRFRVATIERATLRSIDSERRARESERRFRLLFEQAQDAHFLVRDGVVEDANAQAARLLGVASVESLTGKPMTEVLSGSAWYTGERVLPRPDGAVPIACTVTDVPVEGGVLQHVVVRDLTAAKKAEAERSWFESQVREAQKLDSLGTLAGGVAHDFNNLLGVVRGNAELARAAIRSRRNGEEYLAAILDASDRARDIVKQILTFSRRSTPTREMVSLSALIADLQPLLRRLVRPSVAFRVTGTEVPQVIMGDPTQLQQLLLNLVSNADYALRDRADAQLTIAVLGQSVPASAGVPAREVVVLRVQDNGAGMTEPVRSRVFEPFFTTKPTGEGTGLGMAVVHGIVTAHDGSVEVVSAPGTGTTFEMRFPRASLDHLFDPDVLEASATADGDVMPSREPSSPRDGSPAATAGGRADAATGTFPHATILVVDDEPPVARVVQRALEEDGHRVVVFHAPEDALAFVQREPALVDLLVTDQTMPGLTGDRLVESVRAINAAMPVLILTGYSHRLTAERVAEIGARAVLAKPVELEVLRRAVRDALAAGTAP